MLTVLKVVLNPVSVQRPGDIKRPGANCIALFSPHRETTYSDAISPPFPSTASLTSNLAFLLPFSLSLSLLFLSLLTVHFVKTCLHSKNSLGAFEWQRRGKAGGLLGLHLATSCLRESICMPLQAIARLAMCNPMRLFSQTLWGWQSLDRIYKDYA